MRWMAMVLVVLMAACGSSVNQTPADGTVLYQGSFVDADATHKGSGGVKLMQSGSKQIVRLEADFMVNPGPDLFVWLRKPDGGYLEIAQLKKNQGGQDYDIPAGTKLEAFSEVIIWCKQFSVLFAKAELKAAGK